MSKTNKTSKAIKLTDSQVIDLFCQAVNNVGDAHSQTQLSLFIKRKMFGKRLYATPSAAQRAVFALAPKLAKGLKGLVDTSTATRVTAAIRNNRSLRKKAVAAAFARELLYAQPVLRNTPVPSTSSWVPGASL